MFRKRRRSHLTPATLAAALNDMDQSQGEEGADPEGTTTPGTEQLQSNPDYGSNDESPSAAGGPGEGPANSRDGTPDHTQASAFDDVLHYIHELQKSQIKHEECYKKLKAIYQQNYSLILDVLEEKQSRLDRFEKWLDEVIELHQNDLNELKTELAAKEEEIADQSYDATQDFNEVLRTCETRLFKLEQQQEDETAQPERWANTTQHLLGKLLNVPLTIMAVLLMLMSTVGGCAVSFVKTFRRLLCTLLVLILLSFLWRNWETILEHHCLYFCTQHPGKDK